MKNSLFKHSIVSFFLVLFLSVKIAGLHALSHFNADDHDAPCELCDYTYLTPVLSADTQQFSIEKIELILVNDFLNYYNFNSSNKIASNQLFSRPPPFST
jgi:hypothetical protein